MEVGDRVMSGDALTVPFSVMTTLDTPGAEIEQVPLTVPGELLEASA
jgi:hypothetical protein